MKLLITIISIFLINSINFQAQLNYGKELVNKLASDEFYGRGYVNNGERIAADFIASEFKKHGAKQFNESYFQYFNLQVNTFPGAMIVQIQDRILKPGKDYIVDPNSGGITGTYVLKSITEQNYAEMINKYDFSSQDLPYAFVINFEKPKDGNHRAQQGAIKKLIAEKAPLLVINDHKFTWSVGNQAYNFPIIEITSENLEDTDSLVYFDIQNKLETSYQTQNIIGYIEGTCKKKKENYIVFSAHYDHLGMMGKEATFNGANDNASGTAMVINLLKYFSKNPPKQSVVFMLFGAEEAGIVGSKYYTENPLFGLNKIQFVLNLDIFGTGDDGVTVVNATEHTKAYNKLVKINDKKNLIKQVKKRGKAANSDHYWFTEKGVPAFFIYTMGGVAHYHDILDRPETLPLTEFDDLATLMIEFVKKTK